MASPFAVTLLPTGNRAVRLRDQRDQPPAPGVRNTSTQFYIPWTKVYPQVAQAAPLGAVWVDVAEHPDGYWAMLAFCWSKGQNFATIEHDVVCRPDVVEAFESCPEPWCLYGYSNICHVDCQEGWRNQLGCTRFRREAMELVPDAVLSIPADNRDWHNVCDGLGDNLRAAGLTHHWHYPWVDHHPWTDVHPGGIDA